jgi:glutathione S-transferase
MRYKLIIGNSSHSSWSMRAWLLSRFVDAPFEQVSVDLCRPDSRESVRTLRGQAGLVPVLIDDGLPMWDTLAFTECPYGEHPLFGQWFALGQDERPVIERFELPRRAPAR